MRAWACAFFEKHGIEAPQLDADILLADALGVPRIQLLINGSQELDAETLARFKSSVIRRTRHHEPIAYILGRREFWSMDLKVTPDTLIPRPDTECLVEAVLTTLKSKPSACALQAADETPCTHGKDAADGVITYESLPDERLASYIELWTQQADDDISDALLERKAAIPEYDEAGRPLATRDIHDDVASDPVPETPVPTAQEPAKIDLPPDHAYRLIDVGTGSGAIAIALASELKNADWEILAVDISPQALDVARENATKLGFSNILFAQSDLLDDVSGQFDIIVSNPPYVTTGEYETLTAEVKHEPKLALVSGEQGLDIYRRLIPEAYTRLRANGWLAVEIGCEQANAVMTLFKNTGFAEITLKNDYAGKPRIVLGNKR